MMRPATLVGRRAAQMGAQMGAAAAGACVALPHQTPPSSSLCSDFPSCRRIGTQQLGFTLPCSVNVSARRSVVIQVDAKAFEAEVLQSQQAVCVIFVLPNNSACQQYVETCNRLTEELNMETGAAWLKLVVIDGDKNRNLASALSVQRAKLPATFFLMQATIIDKLSGSVTESRIETVLRKFSEHYHQSIGVDLHSNKKSIPIAAAMTSDLTSGAPTTFLQARIAASLVGKEMIRLPEQAAELEGIKKMIQQTKQKAFAELADLHREIGMDVKRLSDEEMESKYFSNEIFKSAAMLSALECLFLARVFGSVGSLELKPVQHALAALKREFPRALSEAAVKKIVSLIEVNMIRGRHRERLPKLHSLLATHQDDAGDALNLLQAELKYIEACHTWIEFVDTRHDISEASGANSEFPGEMVDSMLATLKANLLSAKKSTEAAERAADVRVLLMGVVQMFPSHPQSVATRSRIASLLF